MVPCLLSGEEGLQLFGDDLIQERRFWIARPVSVDSHEGIAECTSTRNSLHHRFSNFRAGRHGEVRLRNDYIPAFVEVLPTSVRCEDQYRVQRGFPRPTALLALNMVDVLESQRPPPHELDPVLFYTILNIGGNLTIVLELCTQIPKLDVAGSIPLSLLDVKAYSCLPASEKNAANLDNAPRKAT